MMNEEESTEKHQKDKSSSPTDASQKVVDNKTQNPNISTAVAPYHQPPHSLDPRDVIKALRRGETGDAEIFAQLFGGRVVFDHAEKRWYLWNEHYWEQDKKSQVVNLVSYEVSKQYLNTAYKLWQRGQGLEESEDDFAKRLLQRAYSLRNKNRIRNVLDLATSQSNLALSGEEWDSNPMLIGVANGVIDLTTGILRHGLPNNFIRTLTRVKWKGIDEIAPRWERFLTEIFNGDAELIIFIQKLLGYGITGMQSEAIFTVFWGEGRNGKDTLLETLLHVLGKFASPVGADVLLASKRTSGAANPYVYALRNLRLAWVNETNEGTWLNAGQVKMLTGGGTITARPLYGNPVTFQPSHLLMLVTNNKPRVRADDYALWKRLVLVPFQLSFIDKPKADFERKREPHLISKLIREESGILAWLVRGCLLWQKEGLIPPTTVKEATEEYRMDEDLIGQFLEECCEPNPEAIELAGDLFQAYTQWSETWEIQQVSRKTFGQRMSKRFEKKRKSGDGRVQYIGIKLVKNDINEKDEQ